MPIQQQDVHQQQDVLAKLQPHEAVAVLQRLLDQLHDQADDLARNVEAFGGFVDAMLEATGNERVSKAGGDFYLDLAEENREYLDELVKRVTA